MTLGLWFLVVGGVILVYVIGHAVGEHDARAIDETRAFNRGVAAEKAIQHAKHSAATRKGHANRKAKKAEENSPQSIVTLSPELERAIRNDTWDEMLRPLTERLPHGDA